MPTKKHKRQRLLLRRSVLLCWLLLACAAGILLQSHAPLSQLSNPENNAACDATHAPVSANSTDIPQKVFAGEAFTANFWLKNTGNSIWEGDRTSSGGTLPYAFAIKQGFWSANPTPLPAGTFYPGDTASLAISATAPVAPQPDCKKNSDGSQDCPFDGQMTSVGIAFGSACSNTIHIDPFAGQCVFDPLSVSDPRLIKGTPFRTIVLCRNLGRNTWKAGEFALEADSPSNRKRWGIESIPLQEDLAPGDIAIFLLRPVSPNDTYNAACATRKDNSVDCLLAFHLVHVSDKLAFARVQQAFHVFDPALTPLPDKLSIAVTSYGMSADGRIQTVTRGQNAWYFFTVSNTGLGDATNVVLTDSYPRQFFQYVAAGSTPGCTDQGKNVTCTVPRIARGTSAQIQLRYHIVLTSPCTTDAFVRPVARIQSDMTEFQSVPQRSPYAVSLACAVSASSGAKTGVTASQSSIAAKKTNSSGGAR